MKKIILSAAIAATMSIPAFADISITGDSHFRYADKKSIKEVEKNFTGQSVRLKITGKAGNSTVKLGLRNDGGTRVSEGYRGSDSVNGATIKKQTGSGRGISSGNAILATDYLYIDTKIGALNIRAGDWWATTGVGLVRKGVPITEGIVFGTSVAGIKMSVKTVAGGKEQFYTFKGKFSGWKAVFQNSDHKTDGYNDITLKGKVAGIGIATEIWAGKVFSANVIHAWKTVSGITWHVARASWGKLKDNKTSRFSANSKFSPLGVSILGTAPGVNGVIALGNVNAKGRTIENEVFGVRADMKVAGMGVQVALGTLKLAEKGKDGASKDLKGAFKDIIVTRALGKGSSLKASYGTYDKGTSFGAKVSVKF